jgi:peptidylprolyl isomerase
MPTVVLSPEGVHGVSFPNAPAPTELRVSVLKQGAGPAVKDGDFVTVHVTGLTWNLRQVFLSSFDNGSPISVVVTDRTKAPDGEGVIPGLALALVGQTVGSQVLVSVPPALGYPEGRAPFGVPDNATLVYIFDILGTQE